MVYVAHDCKNDDCNNRWLDVDLYNAQCTPPKWRYCADCKAKGFVEEKNALKVEQGMALKLGMNQREGV